MYRFKFLLLSLFLVFAFGCEQNRIAGTDNTTDDLGGEASGQLTDLSKSSHTGAVFTMTNASSDNEVLAFLRNSDGSLTSAGSFSTGGSGTGSGLGNQSGVILTANGHFLLVCNAGSDEISVFSVDGTNLSLVETVDSGGAMPISLTSYKHIVYVLNAGGSGNITGFRMNDSGNLSEIGSQPLSDSGTGPAQIGFSPNGRVLVVTEKGTSMIVTYAVGRNGVVDAPTAHPSSGMTPFGFAFDRQGHLVVSEAFGGAANASAASSYSVDNQGNVEVISPSVTSGQSAACWIAITGNGRYAYSTNTGSGNLTGYRLLSNGGLRLLNDSGNIAVTGNGSAPIDMAFSHNSRYLYVLNSGTAEIDIFTVLSDGRLVGLGSLSGLPSTINGLAAR